MKRGCAQVNTLIITDVHARDLVEGFQHDGVRDAADFAWESQLRFYWDRAVDGVVVRQCNGAWPFHTPLCSVHQCNPYLHRIVTLR